MAHQWGRSFCNLGLAGTLTVGGVLAMGDRTAAQLIPDATLGAESSTIVQDEVIGGVVSDRINGGAARGINLFHSFLQFNVDANRGVYFSNPVGIQNILTRVTGDSPSQILGRLGVDGAANLYLLNPNGIIFGPGASLDVQGSFVASTADAIQIGDGFFSTTEPEISPLLTVEPGALFLNSLASQQSGITNQANLVAGQSLVLAAGNINSTGSLQAGAAVDVRAIAGNASIASAAAPLVNLFASGDLGVQNVTAGTATLLTANGNVALSGSQLQTTGDLTVQASNGLFIGDSTVNPFNAQVNGNLRLEGNQGIDIQALNNPASRIQSVGSLDLISSDGSITAAALFNSSGNFSARAATNLNLTESQVDAAANLTLTANTIQLQDSALNPLSLDAGGSLSITGGQGVTIAALSNPASFLQSGTDLSLNSGGNITASAIFTSRANLTATAADLILNESQINATGNVALTAAISILFQDSALNPLIVNAEGGLQIEGGADITIQALNNPGSLFASVGNLNLFSNGRIEGRGRFESRGANVSFSAGNDLTLTESRISAASDVELLSRQAFVVLGDSPATPFLVTAGSNLKIDGLEGITILTGNAGSSFETFGNLELISGNGSVNAIAQFTASGEFNINAGRDIFLPGGYTGSAVTLSSGGRIDVGAIDTSSNTGNGGFVNLSASQDINLLGSISAFSTANGGNGGNVSLISQLGNIFTLSIDSSSDTANGGTVNLEAGIGGITTGAIATNSVNGDAGNVFANAGGNILTGGSVNTSSQVGAGGGITFTSTNGEIDIRAGSMDTFSGNGPGGAVSLTSNGTLTTGAINSFSTDADAGNITLSSQTGGIDTTAGGLNSSSVFGNGGVVTFDAEGDIRTSEINSSSNNGNGSGISLSSTSGSVDTTAGNLFSNSVLGIGGDVSVTANGTITTAIIDSSSVNGTGGDIGLISSGGVNTTGGTLNASSQLGNGGNTSIFASSDIFTADINTSSNSGNGSDISLTSTGGSIDTTAGDLNSSANPSGGSGGNVFLQALDDIQVGTIQADGGADSGGDISLLSNGDGNLLIADRTISSNTFGAGKGGDISFETSASGTLSFVGNVIIRSQVLSGATGAGGDIYIRGGSVLFDDTRLDTTTSGAGNGGSIFVTALNNGTVSLLNSTFQTTVEAGATGTGGDIEIRGGIVSLNGSFVTTGTRGIGRSGDIRFLGDSFFLSGSRLDATTYGAGDAGNIDMIASGAIDLTNSSSVNTEVGLGATGNGGDITFSAQAVSLTVGSLLRALTRGKGSAGNIQLTVPGLIEISGADAIGIYSGLLTSSEEAGGVGIPGSGPGGNITINSPGQPQGTLRVSGGAVLSALTQSDAPGGNIDVYVSNLELTGGGQFTASATETSGGAAGNINVNAVQAIFISGINPNFAPGGLSPNESASSGMFAQSNGSGPAGSVTISTPWMLVQDNAQVSVATDGSGMGGELMINANQFWVDTNARISASTSSIGKGGQLKINADQVEVSGNGAIAASTTGLEEGGEGGELTIATNRLKVLTGGEISASTTGSGSGGQLTINANQVQVQTGGEISASTTRSGSGGQLAINTSQLGVETGGRIAVSTSGPGDGGQVIINASQLTVQTDGGISASSSGRGKGGQLTINADQLRVQAEGAISVSTSGSGDGGQLIITVKQLVVDGGEIAASTFAGGDGGQLDIKTNQLEVQNNGKIAASAFSSGNGGQLIIFADQIRVRSGGEIAASTFADGNGGRLAVSADEVGVESGRISASTGGSGFGGQLVINARQVRVQNNGEIGASSSGSGAGGTLSIFAPQSVDLNSGGKLSTQSNGSGDAGSLSIFTRNLLVQNGAEATVSSTGTGNAGNLTVDARFVILNNGATLSAETASGSGGNIQLLNLERLQLNNSSQISVSTKTGQGGTLSVSANHSINLNNNSGLVSSATAAGSGSAGNVFVSTPQLTLQNGSQISSSTVGEGNAGQIFVQAGNLFLWSGSSITTRSAGAGNAGSINLQISDRVRLNRGEISASSEQGGGGNIFITVRDIELKNSSLISSSVFSGDRGGGNIFISASRIFTAFEDSDILANAVDGRGGSIDIRSPLFIADLFASVGQNPGRDFSRFRGNGQVDISASSRFGVSGVVSIPDFSFLQYSLDQLPDNFVPSEQIVAGSCLARRNVEQGSFVVAGTGGLPNAPDNLMRGDFDLIKPGPISRSGNRQSRPPKPTSEFLPLPTPKAWKQGDPVQEAQGFLKTVDGRIVLGTDAQLAAIAKAQDIICDETESKVSSSRVEGIGSKELRIEN